jgi:mono/diheme cytochrome c family protein
VIAASPGQARRVRNAQRTCAHAVRVGGVVVWVVLFASSACESASKASPNTTTHVADAATRHADDDGSVAGGASSVAHPTYYQHVEPILRNHCVGCHRPAGAAPFSLATYTAVRTLATSVASVTHEHRMPPWPAVTEGDCPPQVGARRLDAADIALIGAWASAGAPEGAVPAVLPALPAAWGTLDHVDAVLRSDVAYTPKPNTDDYRCFIVHPSNAQDRYLTAYAVRQDAPGIIHHVQLWAIDTDADEAQLDQLDAADSGPGYACPDSIGVNGRYVSVWAPSDPIRRHPPDTGMLLTGGHRMVVQFHYHDHGQGRSDQTAIELELSDHVKHPASMWPVSPPDIYLAPGQKSVNVMGSAAVTGSRPYQLWGVRGHMHTLGSSERVSLRDGKGDHCLLSIPRWDSNWQLMYFYEAPVQLAIGSELDVSCTYDTTSQTAPVRYGIHSTDEMCFGYFYVTQD